MTKTTNASRRIRFRITSRDVARAKPKDTHACAAALALKRALGADDVDVRITRTFVEKNGRVTRYETPPALRFEATTLDRGGKFEPGDYEIKPVPPSQSTRAIAIRNKKKRTAKKRSHPYVVRRQTPNVRASARGIRR
jgi:hypothetical protein